MLRWLENARPGKSRTSSRTRTNRPTLEALEDRMLLFATNGGSWAHPVRVTYSFVPDGTSIGGPASNLYATLNSTQSQATWQGAIEQAAAIWETYTNVNLVLVPDNGAPEGVSGNQQGDSRFGDIRISMIPQSPGVLAFGDLPPPINGGTAAGDITFNSNINWAPGKYDLESVALHEFGHALGLDHSSLQSAVMYAYYSGVNQNPTSDDINGIQAVYGAIPAPAGSNHSLSTAWNLSPNINSNGQLALANQSVLGPQDADWWRVTAPANTSSTLTVQMQAANLSSLAPKLVVKDGYGNTLGISSLADQYGTTARVTVNGIGPNQNFFIMDTAASGTGSNGAYGLLVNFGTAPQSPIAPPNTAVAQQPDQGGGTANELINAVTALPGNLLSQLDPSTGAGNTALQNQLAAESKGISAVQFGNLLVYGEAMTIADLNTPAGLPHPAGPTSTPGEGSITTRSGAALSGVVAGPAKAEEHGLASTARPSVPAGPGQGALSGRSFWVKRGAVVPVAPEVMNVFTQRSRFLTTR